VNLNLRTRRITSSRTTPTTAASRGPNPVGAISPPPVGVDVGVAPSGAGVTEPSSITLVAVGAGPPGVAVTTGVEGTVAVGVVTGSEVAVTSATTVGDAEGARNLVYTTKPAMDRSPTINNPTSPIATMMKTLLCVPLRFAIFSLLSEGTAYVL